MTKIRCLELNGFRGAPGSCAIDFCLPRQTIPVSAIIFGENGTGKSTIVDALELALQGTFRRTKRHKSNSLPSILNLNEPARDARINVVFNDATSVTCKIESDEAGRLHIDRSACGDFGLAPIALRRKDI